MSLICHECGDLINNPFYFVNAVLVDNTTNRKAMSDLGVSICGHEFNKVKDNLSDDISNGKNLVYLIERNDGVEGGVTGAVQMA